MYGETLRIWSHIAGPSKEPGRREAIVNAKKAAKPITPDDFYLGPIPFNTQFPAKVPTFESTKWLTNHWPAKRVELRRAMLTELQGAA